jgi:hypothetical protein
VELQTTGVGLQTRQVESYNDRWVLQQILEKLLEIY